MCDLHVAFFFYIGSELQFKKYKLWLIIPLKMHFLTFAIFFKNSFESNPFSKCVWVICFLILLRNVYMEEDDMEIEIPLEGLHGIWLHGD